MYERFQDLLHLAQMMRAGWITLDDIEREAAVSRRTAERIRDALQVAFPGYEEQRNDEGMKAWRIPARELSEITTVSASELEEIDLAARRLTAEGLGERAKLLRVLRAKVAASLRAGVLRRLEPDVAALMEAEGDLMRAGPAPVIDSDLIQTIRLAILAGVTLAASYVSRGSVGSKKVELEPHGLLFGAEHYLVAFPTGSRARKPKLYRLSGLSGVGTTSRPFVRRPDFGLAEFAAGSFGVFQEPPIAVRWVFRPEAAAEVMAYRFHPSQSRTVLADGSVEVTFRAGGLLEMCWHLFIWGDRVTTIEPPILAERYRELLLAATGALPAST